MFIEWQKTPVLEDLRYCVTEKLDGSNVCADIELNGREVRFYTRTGADARQCIPTLNKHSDIFDPLIEAVRAFDFNEDFRERIGPVPFEYRPVSVSFYGEFLSRKNMNRIPYFPLGKADFKIFGMRLGFSDKSIGSGKNTALRWQKVGFKDLEYFLQQWNLVKYLVPVYERHVLLSDLLKRKEFPMVSRLYPGEPEGWVFHPEGTVGEIYKRKNPTFLETVHTSVKFKPSAPALVIQAFEQFLTLNRAYTVQSKLGPLSEENAQAAVSMLIHDAFEDFCETYPEFSEIRNTHAFFASGRKAYDLVRQLISENSHEKK